MHEPVIILKNGTRIRLSEWQQAKGYKPNQVGKFFYTYEKAFSGYFEVSELLIDLLDAYRANIGKPVHVNSLFRTSDDQRYLLTQGATSAKTSAHQFGLAADVDTTDRADTLHNIQVMEVSAKSLGIGIRMGFAKYLERGQSFIHVDVACEYFGKNKPWYSIEHPWQFELQARW